MKELHKNLLIGDDFVWIVREDKPEVGIGQGGVKIPTNMTEMCNYTLSLNPRIFVMKGTAKLNDQSDKLDVIGGPASKGSSKRNTTVAYFQIKILCIKDPLMLISQVSFEWGKFGNFIRLKEFQAIDTQSFYCFYFLSSMSSKQILMEEPKTILKRSQEMLTTDDRMIDFE